MPEAAKKKLKATARKRGYGKKRTDAYVYGGMRNTGWKPKKKRGKK